MNNFVEVIHAENASEDNALRFHTGAKSNQARLDYVSSMLSIESENMSASESAIRDVDMAKEMMNYAASNVLLQASQLMLAQSNQNSSNALSLLQ